MLGGKRGHGLGAYRDSPLAEVLPLVALPPPPRVEPPPDQPKQPGPPEKNPPSPGKKPAVFESRGPASSITVLLLIDKSGSMGEKSFPSRIPAIQFAKEAAIATAETMTPDDRLGVVAFDNTTPHVVIPPGPVQDRQTMASQVARLQPGGGTRFLPVLQTAAGLLRNDPSRIKHVILLTDGQRMDRERYQDREFKHLLGRMTDAKITLSTVGVGHQFEGEFLIQLATWGKGKFYFATSPEDVPRIYTLEADRLLAQAGRKGEKKQDMNPRDVPPDTVPSNTEKTTPGETPAGGAATTRPRTSPPPRKPIRLRLARPHPVLSGLSPPFPDLTGLDPTRARSTSWVALTTREKNQPVLATGPFGAGNVMVFTADLAGEWSGGWLTWKDFPAFVAQTLRFVGQPPSPVPPASPERTEPRSGAGSHGRRRRHAGSPGRAHPGPSAAPPRARALARRIGSSPEGTAAAIRPVAGGASDSAGGLSPAVEPVNPALRVLRTLAPDSTLCAKPQKREELLLRKAAKAKKKKKKKKKEEAVTGRGGWRGLDSYSVRPGSESESASGSQSLSQSK